MQEAKNAYGIDAEVWKRAKLRAVESGKTMRELLEEAIGKYLGNGTESRKVVELGQEVPVSRVRESEGVPLRTCRHGKGKGYNCGLCGGVAKIE